MQKRRGLAPRAVALSDNVRLEVWNTSTGRRVGQRSWPKATLIAICDVARDGAPGSERSVAAS
jgi:hypothetical protein